MNYRDYKQFGPGEYYHIYNRGNSKNDIFLDRDDYEFFIFKLQQNLFPDPKYANRISLLPPDAFSLICYCLMPNHFHLLLRQNTELPTSKLLLKVCTSYSIFFNRKYDRIGHVFQDRFKQINITDNEYLNWLSAYIHLNPKTASLVDRVEDYQWSSYPEFVRGYSGLCEKDAILEQFKNIKEYEKFVISSSSAIKSRKDLEYLLLDLE